jgi:hypothetical protein
VVTAHGVHGDHLARRGLVLAAVDVREIGAWLALCWLVRQGRRAPWPAQLVVRLVCCMAPSLSLPSVAGCAGIPEPTVSQH